MMDTIYCWCLCFFVAAAAVQRGWIYLMRRYDLGEGTKWYAPETHKKKSGTPSMGGIASLLMTPAAVIVLRWRYGADARWLWTVFSFPAACSLIGLIDDAMKRIRHSGDGLTSMQKLVLQIVAAGAWSLYVASDGIFVSPVLRLHAAIGLPVLIFVGVGFMNAVNVTDGLDGLAISPVIVSLIMAAAQMDETARAASSLWIAVASAFLWHNSHPAALFMGDVGSHFWAGLLLALCTAEKQLLLIVPLGFIFGVEIITVSIQIVAIRRFKRKVFLMSPLHHHFELKGYKETKIVSLFTLAHALGMTALLAVVKMLHI